MNGRRTALAAVAALAGLAACGKPPRREPPPVPVLAAVAERRAVPYTIEANGTVEPLQTVAVESQVGGVLLRVGFKEGDEVLVKVISVDRQGKIRLSRKEALGQKPEKVHNLR